MATEKQRENEQLRYQREMFWHKPEAQILIKNLLRKIYNLEDDIKKIKNENKNY